jgi:hypothetical protein
MEEQESRSPLVLEYEGFTGQAIYIGEDTNGFPGGYCGLVLCQDVVPFCGRTEEEAEIAFHESVDDYLEARTFLVGTTFPEEIQE